jgi:hypothetical protein
MTRWNRALIVATNVAPTSKGELMLTTPKEF